MITIVENFDRDELEEYADEIHSVLRLDAKFIFDDSIIKDLQRVYELSTDDINTLCTIYYNKYKEEHFIVDGDTLIEYSGGETDYLKIPDNIRKIDNGVFSNSSVERVDFNNVEFIGEGAFENSQLSSIKLGNKLRYIGNNAFFNTQLKVINIPDNVEYIGKNAFANNKWLENVLIHPMNYLGDFAFAHCYNLSEASLNSICNAMRETVKCGKKIFSKPVNSANYSLEKLLADKEIVSDITTFIKNNYGCGVESKRMFILPDGSCISTEENQPHYTIDSDICDYLEQKYNITMNIKNNGIFGSLILDNLNCIRVNCVFENYVYVPDTVNSVQYSVLCEWLNFFFEITHYTKLIYITDDTGWQESFDPKEMTAEEIIKYLKRNRR